jgi:hypothetical protein
MTGMTPTARTLKALREKGHSAETVEKWLPHSPRNTRKDLFGFIDIVCITGSAILGLQVTTSSNVSARVKKITGPCADAARQWLQSGGLIQVWGWRKKGASWIYRTVDITLEDL